MKLGAYEVTGELGRGGMGVVYRARSAKGEVAVKLLLRLGAERLARFERERRLLGEFTARDGFVPLLDAGTAPEGPYLVMPLLGGGTLRKRLERGALGVAETLELGRRLARAVAKAHARGIVHRDLKPENVLFDDQGQPLVADLGLAKHYDRAAPGASRSVSLSQAGNALGTIAYAAPELFDDAKTAGPPADVFALGAILYECLAGRPALTGVTPVEVLACAAAGGFEPLVKADPAAPAWLARIVERSLSPDAGRRFADGNALLEALERGAAPSRRTGLTAALALAALAIVAAAGALLARSGPTPPSLGSPSAPHVAEVEEAPRASTVEDAPRLEGPVKLLETRGTHAWRTADATYTVAFLPDEKRAVSGDGAGGVRLWDLATGRELRTFAARRGDVALAVSPDGKRIALGQSGENALRVLAVESGKELLVLAGHDGGRIFSIAWSPSGRRILSAGGLDMAHPSYKLWDATSGALVHTLGSSATGVPHGLAFLDERRAVGASWGDHLVVWDLERGEETGQVRLDPDETNTNAIAATGHGKAAVIASRSGLVSLADLSSTYTTRHLLSTGDQQFCVSVSADGSRVASIGDAGFTVFSPGGEPWKEPAGAGRGCSISADGKRLLTGHQDGSLRLWDVDARREISTRPAIGGAVLQLDTSGKVAVSAYASIFELHDLTRPGPPKRIDEHGWWTEGMALSPDGSRLVLPRHFVGRQAELVVYDARSGAELARQGAPRISDDAEDGDIEGVAFTPDGRSFVTTDLGGRVRVYETRSSTSTDEYRVVASEDSMVGRRLGLVASFQKGAAWIAAGNRLVVRPGEVYMTPPPGPFSFVNRPSGTHGDVSVTAVAGRDRYALSGDAKGLVKVWQMNAEPRDLARQGDVITALALSLDERLAATASKDGTVALLEPATGKRVATITLGGMDFPTALVFESATRLHVGTSRGDVLTFDVGR